MERILKLSTLKRCLQCHRYFCCQCVSFKDEHGNDMKFNPLAPCQCDEYASQCFALKEIEDPSFMCFSCVLSAEDEFQNEIPRSGFLGMIARLKEFFFGRF